MKRALVCGAGEFIGMHLVKKLRGLGYWVRGVDIKPHEWSPVLAVPDSSESPAGGGSEDVPGKPGDGV